MTCLRNVLSANLPTSESDAIGSTLFDKLIAFDSLNEQNYALLIRSYLAAGNQDQALRVWRRCQSMLQRELGVSPGPMLQSLYHEELRPFDAVRPSPPAAVDDNGGLIGRENHWSTLTGIAFQNSPKLILIEGEPGIGKTRLAGEFMRYCQARGDTTLKARAIAGGYATPLAPVAEWFRCREVRESFSLIDERKQSLISAVLPELGVQSAGAEAGIPDRFRRERLFSALTQTIDRVEKPLVLFLDDLHWCDEDTLSWLNHLFSRNSPDRLLVVATIRINRRTSRALNAMMRSMEREKRIISIGLEALNTAQSRTLANQILKEENVVASEESLKIFDAAAGNPFHIIEIARVIAEQNKRSENPKAITSGYSREALYDVIRRRLEVLSDEATDALRLLSALRRPFTDAEFHQLSDMDSRNAARILTMLIDADVVTSDDDYRYRLVHDCIAEAFYSELSVPMCRYYHERIACASQWADAQVTLTAGELADHLHQAGRITEAIDWYLSASQEATNRLSSVTGIYYVDTALGLLKPLMAEVGFDQRLVELLVQKLACQQIIDGFFSDAIMETCELLEKTLHQITDMKLRLYVLTRLRSVYGNTNMTRAIEIDKECMALVKKHPDPLMEITARRSMGFVQFLTGNYVDASKTLGGAFGIYSKEIKNSAPEKQREYADVSIMLSIGAIVDWIHGKPQAVHSALSELTSFHYELVPPRLQFFARSFLWQMCFLRRDRDGLVKHHDWFTRAAEAEPNRLIEDHAIWVEGMVAWSNEDYAKAVAYLEQSLQKIDQHSLMLQPQRRLQLAEVMLLNRNLEQAGRYLTLAQRSAQKTEQKYWDSERFRVGALLLEADSANTQEILSCYSRSIEIAKRQQAVYLEIRAVREKISYLVRIGDSEKAGIERRRFIQLFGHLKEYPEVDDVHRMGELEG